MECDAGEAPVASSMQHDAASGRRSRPKPGMVLLESLKTLTRAPGDAARGLQSQPTQNKLDGPSKEERWLVNDFNVVRYFNVVNGNEFGLPDGGRT